MKSSLTSIFSCGVMLILAACSSAPVKVALPPEATSVPETPEIDPAAIPPLSLPDDSGAAPGSIGNEIAIRAIALIGAPYRFGGGGPNAFDCSGLVRYVYAEIGIDVPRTVSEQLKASDRVSLDELKPGDLLFFKLGKSRISHVAIYAGENRFVHAPQTGRSVEIRSFDDGYYRPRLVRAGRLR